MSYLLYSSKEMFSATELLRKSKNIFEKVTSNDIDKAIILRDGKPTFILFDFARYENIMQDYEKYKSYYDTYNNTNSNTEVIKENIHISIDEIIDTKKDDKQKTFDNVQNIEKKIIERDTNDETISVKKDNLDGFEVNLSSDLDDEIPSGEIKEFWNK